MIETLILAAAVLSGPSGPSIQDRADAIAAAHATAMATERKRPALSVLESERKLALAKKWERAAMLSSVGDLVVTEYAIHRCGVGGERNPLMRSRGRRIAIKAAQNVVFRWVARKLGTKSIGLSKITTAWHVGLMGMAAGSAAGCK
jgi:hypothetical protein